MEEKEFCIRNFLSKNGKLQMKTNPVPVLLLTSDLNYFFLILDNAKRYETKKVKVEDASLTEGKVGCDFKAY